MLSHAFIDYCHAAITSLLSHFRRRLIRFRLRRCFHYFSILLIRCFCWYAAMPLSLFAMPLRRCRCCHYYLLLLAIIFSCWYAYDIISCCWYFSLSLHTAAAAIFVVASHYFHMLFHLRHILSFTITPASIQLSLFTTMPLTLLFHCSDADVLRFRCFDFSYAIRLYAWLFSLLFFHFFFIAFRLLFSIIFFAPLAPLPHIVIFSPWCRTCHLFQRCHFDVTPPDFRYLLRRRAYAFFIATLIATVFFRYADVSLFALFDAAAAAALRLLSPCPALLP